MRKTLLILAVSLITFTSCKEETVEKVEKVEENDKNVNELLLGKWQLIKEAGKDVTDCNSKTTVLFEKTKFVSNKYSVNDGNVCTKVVKPYDYIIEGKFIVTVDDKLAPIVIDGIVQKFGFEVKEGKLKTYTGDINVFKKI